MAVTGAYRIRMVDAATVRPARGRHRLGNPGLRYCRHLRPVRARLVTRRSAPLTRHATPVSPARLSAELAMLLLVAMVMGTVLVSGWYAAAGAAVIAGMVAH
jgi:hypothetical protein